MVDHEDIEEYKKYLSENKISKIEDYIEFKIDDWEDNIIQTLKICDYDPFEFFKNNTSKQKSEWFEKIDKIRLGEVFSSGKYSNEDLLKLKKWLDKYILYRTEAIRLDNNIQYYTTIKEQLYVMHLLQKFEIFHRMKISQDLNKQSLVLSLLFNRAPVTFYKNLKIKKDNLGLDEISLTKIKKVFESINNTEIVNYINKDIQKIKSNKS